MRRKLSNLAAAVSLVLCVATAALWIRGHFVADHFWLIHRSGHGQLVRSARGFINFEARLSRDDIRPQERPLVRFSYERSTWLDNADLTTSYPNQQYSWKLGPFSFVKVVYPRRGWMWRLHVPMWLLVALTLPWPAYWYLAMLTHRRRRRAGRCLQCGYDLRATPNRCPECGAVPPHNPPMQRTGGVRYDVIRSWVRAGR